MSSSSAGVVAALVVVCSACGGAPRRATSAAPLPSPGFWESQALEEPPVQPERRPPRRDFEPGTRYEDWPDVYSGAPAGQDDGIPWSEAPVAPPAGPESQRPHHTLLGR